MVHRYIQDLVHVLLIFVIEILLVYQRKIPLFFRHLIMLEKIVKNYKFHHFLNILFVLLLLLLLFYKEVMVLFLSMHYISKDFHDYLLLLLSNYYNSYFHGRNNYHNYLNYHPQLVYNYQVNYYL